MKYKFYSKLCPFYMFTFLLLRFFVYTMYVSAGANSFMEYLDTQDIIISENTSDGKLDLSKKEYKTLPKSYPHIEKLIGKEKISEEDFNKLLETNKKFKKSFDRIRKKEDVFLFADVLISVISIAIAVLLTLMTLSEGFLIDYITLAGFLIGIYLLKKILPIIIIMFLINTAFNILENSLDFMKTKREKRKAIKRFECNLK